MNIPSAKNYVPIADLDALPSRSNDSTDKLGARLKHKYQRYMERDQTIWREHSEIGQLVAAARKGKLLMRNPVTNKWAITSRTGKNADRKSVGGIFQLWSTKVMAEWIASRPEIDPITPSDADEIEEFIAQVKNIQDHYQRTIYTTEFEEIECLSAQDFGTYIHRYDFDPVKQNIIGRLLDFPACRWDITKLAKDSPYFIYHSKISNAVLEQMLDADIPPDGNSPFHSGLQIIEQIAKSGGNLESEGKGRMWTGYTTPDDENILIEMWLAPEAYMDIDLPHDEETLCGQVLKAGRDWQKDFPNGMCVVGIQSMDRIVGIYPESHNDHIVVGLYHRQSFAGIGKGVSDAVDVKKDMDKFRSQLDSFIARHATPATFFSKATISEQDVRNMAKPNMAIPVDFNMAPDGMTDINQAIQTLRPTDPGQSIWTMGTLLNNDLQASFQTLDFAGGIPGMNNKTATGAQLLDQNTQMLLIPQHLNKAWTREQAAKIIFNLFKTYMDTPMWFANNAKNNITAGRYINNEKFKDIELDFQIVANSEVPQTLGQQKQSLVELMQYTGGMVGMTELWNTAPSVASQVMAIFGLKLDIPTPRDISRICRRWVNQAKELFTQEMTNQQMMAAIGLPVPSQDNVDLPIQILSQLRPPISPKEPFLPQKAEWLSNLLDTDELQNAPVEFRYVIEEMIDRCYQLQTYAQMELASDQNAASVMANLPQLIGEQAMSGQAQQMQAEAQAAQQQQQMQQQMQMKMADAQIQEQQASADHQRELSLVKAQPKKN